MNTSKKVTLYILSVFLFFCTTVHAQTKSKPNKDVTVQVHVTDCDGKPAQRAKVVIVDVDFVGDLVSSITNSAGYCSLKVSANNNIEVQTTYKGDVQKTNYFATDENYGNQIVNVKFCTANQIPKTGAIKYTDVIDEVPHTVYLSWDNYGKRWRTDVQTSESVWVDIYDNIAHTYYHFEDFGDLNYTWREKAKKEKWDVSPIKNDNRALQETVLCHSEYFTIKADFFSTGQYFEQSILVHYIKDASTKMLLGKECNLWKNKAGDLIYEWKNVIMLWKNAAGKVIRQVEAISDNVPVSAFTNQTFDPSWIK
jgi:hypothetical protein